MYIYQRYILRNIFLNFLIIAFLIIGVVWLSQILKFLYLIDKGVKLKQFLSMILLILPHILFVVLPFLTTIACTYTYFKLSTSNQLIILRVSGLSNIKLIVPIIIFSITATSLSYYISISLLPLSYIKLKSRLNLIKSNYITNIIHEKSFNDISKYVTIYVSHKASSNEMLGLIILEHRNKNKPSIIFAQSGKYIVEKKPVLHLFNGNQQFYNKEGNFIKVQFSSLKLLLSKVDEYGYYARDINEYYIKELLNQPINRLNEIKLNKLIVEGHHRITWPLYNFTLPLLALSLLLKEQSNKIIKLRQLLIIILLVIIIIYLHFTFQNLMFKELRMLPGLYANFIITILLSLYLLKQNAIK